MWGFRCCLWFMFPKTLTSKTASLSYVSDKMPTAKWPHKLEQTIVCLLKSELHSRICYENSDFYPPRPFVLSLSNAFRRRYVSSVYNLSEISDPLLFSSSHKPCNSNLVQAPSYFMQGASVTCLCCRPIANLLQAPYYFMGSCTLSDRWVHNRMWL